MALSQPRTIFGVHSVTAYNRLDGMPYGTTRVVQGGTFALEGDTIELKGGSNRFSWQIEDGDINATLNFSPSEYANWMFQVFGGKAPTQGSPEASGNVSSLVNKKGTSVVAATGLLSSITASTPADLKRGKYVVKAITATEVKIYAMSDVDFGRGTDVDFVDDTLLVGTFTGVDSDDTFVLTGHGLTLTAGSGTIAFVVGDTAEFEVRPVNTFNRQVVIGGIADEFPEFGAVMYAQKSGSGAVVEIDAFKLKAIGMSLGAERKAFGQGEYSAKASYDTVKNGICKITEIE